MKKTINFIKTRYILSSIIGLVIILIVVFAIKSGNGKYEIFEVTRGDVVQKVVVLGKTKSAQVVDLGFEVSGRVSQVNVSVGDKVFVGQNLVSLDQGTAYAELLKAQANLASEEANLSELKNGARPEEISISEAEVSKAQIAVVDSKDEVSSKTREAYIKSDDVIYNTVDSFFSNPRSQNPQINLTLSDLQLRNNLNNTRLLIEPLMQDWRDSSFDGSRESVSLAKKNLNYLKNFLDLMANAVNSQSANSSLSQTTIDSYKASISAARTTLINSLSGVTTAEEKLNTSESNLVVAERSLTLKKVGATEETIKSGEARVLQAQASVQSAQASLSKLSLRSPLNGVVTVKNINPGEIVTPGSVAVSLISESDLEIEANVSEISIGKVTVGNEVDITFDAFPGRVFKGAVVYIDPAETVVNGVVNYKVTIQFNENYPEVRSGLTANLDIKTSIKPSVLKIPQYGIINKDDGKYVSVKKGNSFEEVKIETGLVGQDGFVEVLSGLEEGQEINLVIKQ